MVIFALGLGLLANPLFDRKGPAGNAVVNTLLIGYALPALISAILARRVRGMGWTRYASLASSGAILCLFAYASLEVRRVFQGGAIDLFQGFTQGELYAYSAAWLTLGILLLGYRLLHGSREARLASACFVVASVLKVFLIDLASLEGILRVLASPRRVALARLYFKLKIFARRIEPRLPTMSTGERGRRERSHHI
jgi:uncharacterized membrane protein